MSTREVYQHPLLTLTIEADGRLARVRRSSLAMTGEEFARVDPMVASLLPMFRRPKMALLMDSRDAPMVFDPYLERVMAESFRRLSRGFAAVGVLLSSSLGKRQTQRISERDQLSFTIFSDENEAIEALLAAVPRGT
ncbi:MAG: hypothetical protein JNJ46_31010 [Myxococcales bacterium]|nr:hypothetical protein [Myxococcales bacterium]